eukprot:30962-Pelagococcus_subviridis.AAC.13
MRLSWRDARPSFAVAVHRASPAFRSSASHRIALYGSRTIGSGTNPPTICSARPTSRRGKTKPGESHRHVLSSRMSVCNVFVCPGVAFTLTAFLPRM